MTNITILNGIANNNYGDFEDNLDKFIVNNRKGINFNYFTLRNMDIKYCCGCWVCWVKTPGICTFKDDMPQILQSIINSDLTVYISSVNMGFVSSFLKKVNDRMIPLVHPYIEIDHKECHHEKRYLKYPKFGLILVDKDIDSLDGLDIIVDIYKRISLNTKSELCFSLFSNGNVEEFNNEINNIKWFTKGHEQ